MLEREVLKYFGVYFDNTQYKQLVAVSAFWNLDTGEIREPLKEGTDSKTGSLASTASQDTQAKYITVIFLPLSDLKFLKANYFSLIKHSMYHMYIQMCMYLSISVKSQCCYLVPLCYFLRKFTQK